MKRVMGAVVGAMMLAGCGNATIWSQDGEGGVLALHGAEGAAFDDAHEKMAAHCGKGRYEIVRRDTVVVGSEAYTSQRTDYGENRQKNNRGVSTQGGSQTTAVSGVQDVYETRLTYRCVR